MAVTGPIAPAPLPTGNEAGASELFRSLWPRTIEWVEPYYDAVHLFHTGRWLLTLDAEAAEPLLVAAVTHDMERHFPGGTQPDKAVGAWDDVEYNLNHCRRSADVVGAWLRAGGVDEEFAAAAEAPILEHEFGGSPDGDVLQAADSLSFLEVNGRLVSKWVLEGETSLDLALVKLDWMIERIKLERARELALPLHERAVAAVRADVAGVRS